MPFDRRHEDKRKLAAVICSALAILGVYVLIYSFIWKSWITQLDRDHASFTPKDLGGSDSVSFPDN